MDLQLAQRRVLVSGGSRGIGRAIVEHFLAEGAEVAFCARGEAGVAEAADCFGERAFGMSVDITDPQQVRGWVTRSALHLGGIDIVVPNVSALAGGGDLDTWRRAFETDLLGSVGMVAAALPWLKRSEAASVVLISSVSGREVDMFAEPYGVLKAALVHYGKTLASRHAEDGIRVNTVRRATSISKMAYGARSNGIARKPSPVVSPPIPWGAWRDPTRWRGRCCSWPARRPASPPEPTCWWTAG